MASIRIALRERILAIREIRDIRGQPPTLVLAAPD